MADDFITTTTQANVIPEIWEKEIIFTLQNKRYMRNVVDTIEVPEGADTQHYPTMGTFTAEEITEGTVLESANITPGQTDLVIDQLWAVPFTISRRAMIQSQKNVDWQRTYQMLAADALAKKLDDDGHAYYSSMSQAVTCTTNMTAAKILEAIELLDEANAPEEDRFCLIHPNQKEAILQIANFVQAQQYGSAQMIQRGEIGMVYGVRFLVTNSISTTTTHHYNLMLHRDYMKIGIQQDVKVDPPQWMTLRQGWDSCATILYGSVEKRDDHGVSIRTTV